MKPVVGEMLAPQSLPTAHQVDRMPAYSAALIAIYQGLWFSRIGLVGLCTPPLLKQQRNKFPQVTTPYPEAV